MKLSTSPRYFSTFFLMRNRFARGAMLIMLALAVAIAAYRYGAYSSPEAKQARFRASIEKELQAMEFAADSLRRSFKACTKIDSSLKPGTKEYFKEFNNLKKLDSCKHLPVNFYLSKYDSLNLYRKLNYDCQKMRDYFTVSKRLERLPPYCKKR